MKDTPNIDKRIMKKSALNIDDKMNFLRKISENVKSLKSQSSKNSSLNFLLKTNKN